MGNIGIVQLLIVAVIIILLFGTKKLRGLGGDLGGAIKGFKKAITDDDAKSALDDKTTQNKEAESVQSEKKVADKE
jgi:sec-independent protein translocase protein TatA